MKRTLWFVAWLLAFFGMSAVQAAEMTHVVRPGETLRTIAGANWKAVCQANSLKSCNLIRVGQKLRLTAIAPRANKVRIAAVVSHPSCITLGAAPWNPERYLPRTLVGIDHLTTLTPVQKAVAKQKVTAGEKASQDELTGRTVFREMLYQSKEAFAKAKHVYDKPVCTPEEGGRPEVMDTYDLGDGTYLAIPRRCGNPAVYMKPVAPPAIPEAGPVLQDLPPAVPPAISAIPAKNVMREVAEYEAIVGAGVWDNRLAHGDWQYGEASIMAILPDGYRLGGGVYGMRGSGESEMSEYAWKERGWGPQLVLKKNFMKEHEDQFGQSVEYPAMWGIKIRHIGNDYASGGNPVSGYHQTQTGKKLGVFAEYGEQASLDWKWGVTGEIWESYDRKIASTWSGDKPQDRGSWALNAYAQQRLDDDWQVRYVAGVSHQNWDDLDYLNLQAEARYKETVMCGPRVSLALNHPKTYRGIAQSDLTTWGAFCRVETFGVIRMIDTEEKMDAVQKVGTVPAPDVVEESYREPGSILQGIIADPKT